MISTPRTVRLHGEGNKLVIEWADGHQSAFSYQYLRDRCPCATCLDSNTRAPQRPGLLPMFGSGPLKPEKAELVGRYALQIFWNDGHSTGIYTFDYLRDLCPCEDCEAAREKVQ
ncbi:MAG: DUF971 domain-containing protein [Acidobacteria bacterium]|nr:MAG: DUF971 domain-containing protein [Acidobacteriota bacterium]